MAVLNFDIRTRTAKFEQGMSNVSRRLNMVNKQTRNIATGLSALFAGGIFARATSEALQFADSIQKLSIRTGASTEFLSEMRFVAEQSGVSFDKLTNSISLMQDNIIEAEKGMLAQSTAFKQLGIDVSRFKDLKPDEQFEILADSLNSLDNQAQKVNIARDIFGRSGADFLQMTQEGAQGIRDLRTEASNLGQTLTLDAANSAAAANDAMNRMRRSMTGVTQTMAIQLGPTIENVANFLTEFMAPSLEFAGRAFNGLRFVIIEFVNASVKAWQFLFEQAAKLPDFLGGDKFEGIAASLSLLSESLEVTSEGFKQGAMAAGEFNSQIASIPLVADAAAVSTEKLSYEAAKAQNTTEVNKRASEEGQKSHLDRLAGINAQGAKKIGAVTKSAGIASATIEGYKAIQKAWASAPFPANLGAVALTTAETFANIAAIKGTSFAGGGFTGLGGRVGGVDGIGGFPAILHPNETVIDHSKGQGVGGTNIAINVTANDASGFQEMLETQRGYIHNIVVDALADSGRSF